MFHMMKHSKMACSSVMKDATASLNITIMVKRAIRQVKVARTVGLKKRERKLTKRLLESIIILLQQSLEKNGWKA